MSARRNLLIVLGAVALTPCALLAQSKPAPVVIGWLAYRSRKSSEAEFSAFKEGLAAFGWTSERIVIEERWADGYEDRLPSLARDIMARKPAIRRRARVGPT